MKKKTLLLFALVLIFVFSLNMGVSASLLDALNLGGSTTSLTASGTDGADVEWPGAFNLNDYNSNTTSIALPTDADTAIEAWATTDNVGNGQITIVGDYVYTYDGSTYTMGGMTHTGNTLYKINKDTGKVVASLDLGISTSYWFAYTCYGEGKIFIGGGNAVAAVNIDTFTLSWKTDYGVGSYPVIQYHDGYVYGGNHIFKASDGTIVATLDGNYNYSSGAFVQNAAGHDIYYIASYTGVIYAIDTDDNWKTIDSYTFKTDNTGVLEPGVTYSAADNRFYWADAMTSKIYSIALDSSKSGAFSDSTFLQTTPSSQITTTCTPVVFNGRVYLGGQGGVAGGGAIEVFDSTTLQTIYYAKGAKGKIQSTPLLDTSKFASTGKVYLIAQEYGAPGKLYVMEDSSSTTSGKLTVLATPSVNNYAYEQLAFDKDGALYYMNDSGYLMKLVTSNSFLSSLTCDGTANNYQATLDNATFDYDLPTTKTTDSVKVSYTLPDGVHATLNGESADTGGTVTLTGGEGTATIVVTSDANSADAHTYTLNFAPNGGDATLSSLVVSRGNANFSLPQYWLSTTPEFSPNEDTFVVTPYSWIYFQLAPSSATATVKVVPVTPIKNTYSLVNGELKQYTSQGGPYYTVQVPDDMNYAMVDIIVTSGDQQTQKTYHLVAQRSNTYGVSVADDANNGMGSVSVDSNNLRGAAGDTVHFTAAAKAGYAIKTLTITGTSGDKVAVHDDGNGNYSFTMPGEDVTINATYGERGSTTRTYSVFYDTTGLNPVGGVNTIDAGGDLAVSFTADPNYVVPEDLHVIMGGTELKKGTDYTFTKNGLLLITDVSGDIEIFVDDYKVTCEMAYYSFSGAAKVQGFTDYQATITSTDPEVCLPDALCVKAGDTVLTEGTDYTYDPVTGKIVFPAASVRDDISIDYDFGSDFTVNSQGYLTAYTGSGGDITIPEGVVGIYSNVFRDNATITSVTLPKTMTTLNGNAFRGCSALKTVACSNKLTSIDPAAFYGCTALTDIDCGSRLTTIGANAFCGCSALTSVDLPDTVTSIDYQAFMNCTSLQSVSLPQGTLTTIPDKCFYGDTALTSITFPKNITTLGNDAFSGCSALTDINFGSRVSTLGGSCFSDCTSLEEIALDSRVSSVGRCCFKGCTSLKDIDFGSGMTEVFDNMFQGCTALTAITIPDQVTTLDSGAFMDCTNLSAVTLGKGLTTMKGAAFTNCTSLTSLALPAATTSVSYSVVYGCTAFASFTVDADSETYSANDGVLFSKDGTTLALYPVGKAGASYTVPSTVTALADSAFYGNYHLASVTLPSNLQYIGSGCFATSAELTSLAIPGKVTSVGRTAFSGCYKLETVSFANGSDDLVIGDYLFGSDNALTSVTLPTNLTNIGKGTFNFCSALTSITIPNKVTSIGDTAFSGCSSLESCTIPDSVTSIGQRAFQRCSSLTSLDIAGSVSTLSRQAFYGCSKLASLTLHKGLETIDANAFQSCSSLSDVTIPSTVKTVNNYAFYGISNPSKITFMNPGTFTISSANSLASAAVIYGYSGSSAQTYATKNNRTFVALDDTVALTPTVKDGAASAALANAPEANTNGYILSAVSNDSTVKSVCVTIPASLVSQMTGVKVLTVKTDLADFTFDENALALMNKASGDLKINVAIKDAGYANSNVGNYKDKVVYECSVTDSTGANLLSAANTTDKNVSILAAFSYDDADYAVKSLNGLDSEGNLVKINTTYASSSFKGTLTYLDTYLLVSAAVAPAIDTNLDTTENVYGVGDTADALTVAASAADSGDLSYQWYSNTGNGISGGTALDGATAASYTPDTSVAGTTWYYVTVTDQMNGTTAAKSSAITPVTVKDFDGYVYFDVERTTIGQGILVEPIKTGYWTTDTLADITERALKNQLGTNKTVYNGTTKENYYLSAIKDGGVPDDWTADDIPQILTDALGDSANGKRKTADTLANFDYSSYSGWYFGVDNVSISLGANNIFYNADKSSDTTYTSGSVVRLCFTYYGLGEDCFASDWQNGELELSLPDRDALVRTMADATDQSSNAYQDALGVLSDWGATQAEIDAATYALGGSPAARTVTFYDDDGETVLDTVEVPYGSNAGYSKDTPSKAETDEFVYTFNGWYTKSGGSEEANLTGIIADTDVYAGYTAASKYETAAAPVIAQIAALSDTITLDNEAAIRAARGAFEALTEAEQGSVTNIDKLVAAEEAIANLKVSGYGDISDKAWYFDDVSYIVDQGLMKGVGSSSFAPNQTLTREMFVTILYRAAGEPSITMEGGFNDVATGKWYTAAVLWASQNGIVNGISENEFGIGDAISRQDMAVMIVRYAGYAGISLADGSDEPAFADDQTIADYAKAAVYTLKKSGILSGVGNDCFDPHGQGTRAQCARIIHLLLTYK